MLFYTERLEHSSNPGLIEQSSATGASRSPHIIRRDGWDDALKLVIERREWSVGWTMNVHDSDAGSTRRDSQLHLKLEWRRHEIVELNWLNAIRVYESQSTTTTVIGRRWAEVSINGKSSRTTSDHSLSYSACHLTSHHWTDTSSLFLLFLTPAYAHFPFYITLPSILN